MRSLACERIGDAELIWHERDDLDGVDAIVIPGGFSYGDYLRAGAIARFAPAMEAVARFADGRRAGAWHLQRLPGALRGRAASWRAAAERGPSLSLPPGRTRGRQLVDLGDRGLRARRPALDPGQAHERPLVRAAELARASSSATSRSSSATPPVRTRTARSPTSPGVCNERGNVVGLMPHPEHAVDPLTGSDDGLALFASLAQRAAETARSVTRDARRRRSSSASGARARRCCG